MLDADVACKAAVEARRTGTLTAITAEACAEACDDSDINSCHFDTTYIKAFEGSNGIDSPQGAEVGDEKSVSCPARVAIVTCDVIEEIGGQSCDAAGRRPAGLVDVAVNGTALGAYFAKAAHLEAASIIAFDILHEELAALGAPPDLLDDIRSAQADEVRHTATMTRLAKKYGARAQEPEVALLGARSVLSIAVENAVEGMVRETFGAAVALFQAEHAADPDVREAMRVIARDECAHAALSFRVAAHLGPRLDTAEREKVAASKREAIRALFASLTAPNAALACAVGLPSVADAARMLDGMRAELWDAALAA